MGKGWTRGGGIQGVVKGRGWTRGGQGEGVDNGWPRGGQGVDKESGWTRAGQGEGWTRDGEGVNKGREGHKLPPPPLCLFCFQVNKVITLQCKMTKFASIAYV